MDHPQHHRPLNPAVHILNNKRNSSSSGAATAGPSRAASTAAPPSQDLFRPKLPVDPFAELDTPQPWLIPAHQILSALSAPARQVVLVLGAPSTTDLHFLLHAPSLAHALLLIATHTPLTIPAESVKPTVRVLHLISPLAVEDSGALRLVGLLKRAERVAHVWRNSPTRPHQVIYMTESNPGGEFMEQEALNPAEALERDAAVTDDLAQYPSPPSSSASSVASTSTSTRPRPVSSSTFSFNLSGSSSLRFPLHSSAASSATSFRPSSAALSTVSLSSIRSSKSRSSKSVTSGSALPPTSHHGREKTKKHQHGRSDQSAADSAFLQKVHRAFDAIVNFLPGNIPEKSLLKHAILVTTLGGPFLADPDQRPNRPQGFDSTKATSDSAFRLSRTLSVFSPRSSRYQDNTDAIGQDVLAEIERLNHEAASRRARLVHILPIMIPLDQASVGVASSSSSHSPEPASSSTPPPSRPTIVTRTSRPPSRSKPIPKPKPKLAQSVEQFLLGFGYPLTSLSDGSSSVTLPIAMDATTTQNPSNQRPVPYLLPNGVWSLSPGPVFASTTTSSPTSTSSSPQPELDRPVIPTIGELILGGALDSLAGTSPASRPSTLPRAWIGGVDEVRICGDLSSLKCLHPQSFSTGLPTPPESSSSVDSDHEQEDSSTVGHGTIEYRSGCEPASVSDASHRYHYKKRATASRVVTPTQRYAEKINEVLNESISEEAEHTQPITEAQAPVHPRIRTPPAVADSGVRRRTTSLPTPIERTSQLSNLPRVEESAVGQKKFGFNSLKIGFGKANSKGKRRERESLGTMPILMEKEKESRWKGWFGINRTVAGVGQR